MNKFDKMNKAELIAELEKHYGTAEAEIVTHSRDCAKAFWPLIKNSKKDPVVVMYLDSANAVIETEVVTRNGLENLDDEVYRKIFRKAIELSSATIITGSKSLYRVVNESLRMEDLEAVRKIIKKCEIIGIDLLDHVIMHKSGHYSCHGNGKI